jgi:hypothetical protein
MRMYRSTVLFNLTLLGLSTAHAAAPFLTDDPDAGTPHAREIYFFSQVNWTDVEPEEPYLTASALEVDLGVLEDLQLHATLPYDFETTSFSSPHGLGDVELGAKYRIIRESDHVPQFSFAPRIQLPTGNAEKGLGNGRPITLVPFYLQKSFGPWTTYGGGGYGFNTQKGTNNFPFVGWVAQRDLSDKWTLGAELHFLGPLTDESATSTVLDFGGYYHIDQQLSLLFSAGGSIQGQSRTVGYLGIHWVGGE